MKPKIAKTLVLAFLTSFSVIVVMSQSVPSRAQTAALNSSPPKESPSLSVVLATLAGERYSIDSKRGDVCILVTHSFLINTNVLKFSDKKYTIVSLPILNSDHDGFCVYVSHYNTYNIKAADEQARAGNFKKSPGDV